jgi:glutathione S-transferase
MLRLMYSQGSPFARGIRVILNELALPYQGAEPEAAPTPDQLGTATPTMQVPTLRDGDLTLWDSATIAEYLLATYRTRPATAPPLASVVWRSDHLWRDKQLFSTIQTFGTAATTISQLTWSGVRVDGNSHLRRCADRMNHILGWLEGKFTSGQSGLLPDCLSVQDIFLVCHIRFVQARPLGVDLKLSRYEGISRLVDALDRRPSFRANPVWWWDPDVTGYASDGTPTYADG